MEANSNILWVKPWCLFVQFLEQKYGYYHCKDCNIRWESAYVWCVQGTNKVRNTVEGASFWPKRQEGFASRFSLSSQVYFKQFCRTCQKSYNPYRVEDITCQVSTHIFVSELGSWERVLNASWERLGASWPGFWQLFSGDCGSGTQPGNGALGVLFSSVLASLGHVNLFRRCLLSCNVVEMFALPGAQSNVRKQVKKPRRTFYCHEAACFTQRNALYEAHPTVRIRSISIGLESSVLPECLQREGDLF